MTAIDPDELIELIHEQRRRVRDCIAIEVEGPRCPLCHCVADDPEHGGNRRKAVGPGKFEGQREILRDAYHLWLEGGGTIDDGVVTVALSDGTEVSFTVSDDESVREVRRQ